MAIPVPASLITNAVRAAESRWRTDLQAHLGDLIGADRLRATLEWHLSTEPEDLPLRTLWVEMRASAHTDPGGVDRQEPRTSRQEFRDASVAAGVPDAVLTADVPSLLTRGCHVSSMEEPAHWTPERAGRVARAVVDALMDT
ncbi:hypothetical protein GCM10010129_72730 [Streptomyces fumigatiscleroticus]|nr:hypothetical protein GCM10010129_72730 [Streptomyces fumigatiscleroticus]